MKTQLINFAIPEELLKRVDKLAKKQYRSRSEVLRDAARRLLEETRTKDRDFSIIYSSGKRINMSEDEAITLVDKGRNSLQINK